jgi:hypothetical protein
MICQRKCRDGGLHLDPDALQEFISSYRPCKSGGGLRQRPEVWAQPDGLEETFNVKAVSFQISGRTTRNLTKRTIQSGFPPEQTHAPRGTRESLIEHDNGGYQVFDAIRAYFITAAKGNSRRSWPILFPSTLDVEREISKFAHHQHKNRLSRKPCRQK